MLRSLVVMTLFGMALSGPLSKCGSNSKGYCYGYLSDGSWCWLTWDAKSNYVKNGDHGYSCSSFNSYPDSRYCKNGQTVKKSSSSSRSSSGGRRRKSSSSSGSCKSSWSCPSSWTTGSGAPSDAPDAKAFVAVHNIYRCMHNVQAVQWDGSVYASAKKWARRTGTSMTHSSVGTYRPSSDGENLAGTFKYSKHPNVDGAHNWYSEIVKPCGWRKSCYQSFSAGHFTAMVWKTVNKIAVSNPTKKLSVGRYRGCDGKPPNFNSAYKSKVPKPVRSYGYCESKVLKCKAFKGLKGSDLEGCDGGGKWTSSRGWYVGYKSKCEKKYKYIVNKASRLYDLPEFLEPLASSSPWPLAVAASAFLLLFAFSAQRAWRHFRAPRYGAVPFDEENHIKIEDDIDDSLKALAQNAVE